MPKKSPELLKQEVAWSEKLVADLKEWISTHGYPNITSFLRTLKVSESNIDHLIRAKYIVGVKSDPTLYQRICDATNGIGNPSSIPRADGSVEVETPSNDVPEVSSSLEVYDATSLTQAAQFLKQIYFLSPEERQEMIRHIGIDMGRLYAVLSPLMTEDVEEREESVRQNREYFTED